MGTLLQFTSILFLASGVSAQTWAETKCQPVSSPFCNIGNYETMQPFWNTLGHKDIGEAISEMHKFGFLFNWGSCKSKIELFLCSLYVPVCTTPFIMPLFPCRDGCEQAREVCTPELNKISLTWPKEWDCTKFNYSRTDTLCVIDNAKNKSRPTGPFPSNQPSLSVTPPTFEVLEHDTQHPPSSDEGKAPEANSSVCEPDLFDCQLTNSKRNRNPVCIEQRFVCDGNMDCYLDGNGVGRDEIGCESKCPTEGDLFCDGKCIGRASVCNGILDCHSGLDERDCYDHLTGLLQSVMLIFSLFSVIFVVIRCIRSEEAPDNQVPSKSHDDENSFLPEETIIHSIMKSDSQYRSAGVYEEPYDLPPEGEYERVNVAGSNYTPPTEFYADLSISRPIREPISSVWYQPTSTWVPHPSSARPAPSPPPPTPALEGSLYDNSV